MVPPLTPTSGSGTKPGRRMLRMDHAPEPGGELRVTPLDAVHRSLGAKMGPFAGWLMPIP